MSEYPLDWTISNLGAHLTETKERAGDSNAIPYSVSKVLGIVPQSEKFNKRVASSDTSNYKVIRKGDFAYDPMLLWDGSINRMLREGKGAVSPAYVTFRVTSDSLNPDYLLHLLKASTTKNFYKSISKGTNVRRQKAEYGDFAGGEFAFPPLPEQKKIAEILSRIDMAIKNQRLAIDKLSATHRIACQKKISDLSRNSEMATIRSISNKIIDYRGKSPPKHETGVPLITAKNIRKGFIDMNPAEYIQEDLYEEWMAKGIPSPGDILVTTEAPLGNVAIAPSSKFAIGQRVICISPNRAMITPEYLLACMKTDDFQGQLTASSTGSTVSGVRQGVLLDCNIPLPGIEWQRRIGNFDLNASKLINALTAKKAKLAILKQSLASDLLSGRKRVSV